MAGPQSKRGNEGLPNESSQVDANEAPEMGRQPSDQTVTVPGQLQRRHPDKHGKMQPNGPNLEQPDLESEPESSRKTSNIAEIKKKSSPDGGQKPSSRKRKQPTEGENVVTSPAKRGRPKAEDKFPKGFLGLLPAQASKTRLRTQCQDYRAELRKKEREIKEKNEQVEAARRLKGEYHRTVIGMQDDIQNEASKNHIAKTDDGMVREKLGEVEKSIKDVAMRVFRKEILADILSENDSTAFFQLFTDGNGGTKCHPVTKLGQQQIWPAAKGAYLLLHSFIAHYVYHNIFEKPFFMLYEQNEADGASSVDAVYKHIMSRDSTAAETWLAMTLKHVIPDADNMDVPFGHSNTTFHERMENYYRYRALLFTNLKPLRMIMLHNSCEEEVQKFLEDLTAILRKAGEIACDLRRQNISIKCRGCRGSEIRHEPFFTSQYRKIHPLMRLPPDDTSLDGKPMNLVVSPAITAVDVDRHEKLNEHKILKKALVWGAPAQPPATNDMDSTPHVGSDMGNDSTQTSKKEEFDSTVGEYGKKEAEAPQGSSTDQTIKQELKEENSNPTTAHIPAPVQDEQKPETQYDAICSNDTESADANDVKTTCSPKPEVQDDVAAADSGETGANGAGPPNSKATVLAPSFKRQAGLLQGPTYPESLEPPAKRSKSETPAGGVLHVTKIFTAHQKPKRKAAAKKLKVVTCFSQSSSDEDEARPASVGPEDEAAETKKRLQRIAAPEQTCVRVVISPKQAPSTHATRSQILAHPAMKDANGSQSSGRKQKRKRARRRKKQGRKVKAAESQ